MRLFGNTKLKSGGEKEGRIRMRGNREEIEDKEDDEDDKDIVWSQSWSNFEFPCCVLPFRLAQIKFI